MGLQGKNTFVVVDQVRGMGALIVSTCGVANWEPCGNPRRSKKARQLVKQLGCKRWAKLCIGKNETKPWVFL